MAQEQYDDALSSGQQAFQLEESDESPDVFKLSVGSLPPGEKASVSLDYVTELAVQADDGLRLCLPAVLNPRYQPQGSDSGSSAQVSSVPTGSVPYSLSLSAHVLSPHPICRVESNCPLDPLNYLNTEKTQATSGCAAGKPSDATGPSSSTVVTQTLQQAFKRQAAYAPTSKHAQDLTAPLSYYIAKDMMSFQIVERLGFLRLMKVAVPHYKVPSRILFSKTKIPNLYNQVKANVGTFDLFT